MSLKYQILSYDKRFIETLSNALSNDVLDSWFLSMFRLKSQIKISKFNYIF